MVRKQIIPPNLTVIDFESIITNVERSYYKYIIDDTTLKSSDRTRLFLYYTYKEIIEVLNSISNRKDVVFYVNVQHVSPFSSAIKSLKTLLKTFPIIVVEHTIDFDNLSKNTGESIELKELIRNKRFSFDYSAFSKRKMVSFLNYRGIKLQFPT